MIKWVDGPRGLIQLMKGDNIFLYQYRFNFFGKYFRCDILIAPSRCKRVRLLNCLRRFNYHGLLLLLCALSHFSCFLIWFCYRVFVSTWNVGGIAPDEDLNMEDLLETCDTSCDIYVLGYIFSKR